MRRFLTLVSLLCLAIPAGISISGCTRNPGAAYCNGLGYGLKNDQVASITLSPTTTGISLAYGQTKQLASPAAYTCTSSTATVSKYSYGSTNYQLVDVSTSGNLCAGTWNRNTGGGIADYTICTPPADTQKTTNGQNYNSAYVTAEASSVTSNAVQVFVHPAITSAQLALPNECYSQNTTASLDVQACYSGTKSNGSTGDVLLCAPSAVTSGTLAAACDLPQGVSLASIPACSTAAGVFTYTVGTSTVATIDSTTNTITANLPGTTPITAAISNSTSSAGYFSTCSPKSISLTFADGTKTPHTITKGVTQTLIPTVLDTLGNKITGLSLDYQSTDPMDISVTSAGAITTNYAGTANIFAVCQPGTCNPAPASKDGLSGTGLSITSNAVQITTPGEASDYVWFASPGNSQYFVPVELLSGTIGSTVRLPYVPNSMVMDRNGTSIYFGSSHELMVYSASSNGLTSASTAYPGVVLAVSPSNSQVLINDQARHVLYIYSVSAGTATAFSGMATSASWSPDSKTLYITDNANMNTPSIDSTGATCSSSLITGHTDTLYVYNVNTGMTSYSLPPSPLPDSVKPTCSTVANNAPTAVLDSGKTVMAVATPNQSPALTIPSAGAYLRGTPTVAHDWCPTGTVGAYDSMVFYPLGDMVYDASGNAVQSDALAATPDSGHILSAMTSSEAITLNDIALGDFADSCLPDTTDATTLSSGASLYQPVSTTYKGVGGADNTYFFSHSVTSQALTTKVPVASVNQIIPSPASSLAFVTYTPTTSSSTTAGVLPYYIPGTSSAEGTVGTVALTAVSGANVITAPLAGAFTPDNVYFFVSTAGDNMIHYIDVATLTDKTQIAPSLPACTTTSSGGTDSGCVYTGSSSTVPATAIAVKPRATT